MIAPDEMEFVRSILLLFAKTFALSFGFGLCLDLMLMGIIKAFAFLRGR